MPTQPLAETEYKTIDKRKISAVGGDCMLIDRENFGYHLLLKKKKTIQKILLVPGVILKT